VNDSYHKDVIKCGGIIIIALLMIGIEVFTLWAAYATYKID